MIKHADRAVAGVSNSAMTAYDKTGVSVEDGKSIK